MLPFIFFLLLTVLLKEHLWTEFVNHFKRLVGAKQDYQSEKYKTMG